MHPITGEQCCQNCIKVLSVLSTLAGMVKYFVLSLLFSPRRAAQFLACLPHIPGQQHGGASHVAVHRQPPGPQSLHTRAACHLLRDAGVLVHVHQRHVVRPHQGPVGCSRLHFMEQDRVGRGDHRIGVSCGHLPCGAGSHLHL